MAATPGKGKQTGIKSFFAPSREAASPSPTPQPVVAQPVPSWGKLIQPQAVKQAALKARLLQVDGASLPPRHHSYHPCYQPVFNDSYYRAPGVGSANQAFWGGGRSALQLGTKRRWSEVEEGEGVQQEEEEEEDMGLKDDDENGSRGAKPQAKSNLELVLTWALGRTGFLHEEDVRRASEVLK